MQSSQCWPQVTQVQPTQGSERDMGQAGHPVGPWSPRQGSPDYSIHLLRLLTQARELTPGDGDGLVSAGTLAWVHFSTYQKRSQVSE